MTATTVRPRAGGAPAVSTPAVGSLAMVEALSGAPSPWQILGTSTHAWWCASGDEVLVIADDAAVRLPNAVVAPAGFKARPPPTPDEELVVGDRRVGSTAGEWRIVRWWDPHVHPVATDRSTVRQRVLLATGMVPVRQGSPFVEALRAGDADGMVDAGCTMLGWGPGLTPQADDFITGVIAAHRHVAASTGNATAAGTLGAVREPLLLTARSATTLLSYSLLRHAFDGVVAGPLGRLLRALTGRGGVEAAVAATLVIGHSSGPALASGALAGAAAACDVAL